ncbi:MAG: helix-turn-helix domain-containing protein [Burkholderiales bacterium]|nr:helix-turn-helix domain-containing protein [Burkholderiales bacterium]
MIKNEWQYRLSKSHAAQFRSALEAIQRQGPPTSIHPLLWKAQIEAIASQYDDLQTEIQEYEKLLVDRPFSIIADNLEDLPRALIKARIALDLSQKQLAERMGLKEQQIQRYEATNYASATLARLNEAATALGVRISERVLLPQVKPTKSALFERMHEIGIDDEFLVKKLLPTDVSNELEDAVGEEESVAALRAANVVARIYGWGADELFGVDLLTLPNEALATARFKLPANAQGKRLGAYVVYAHYLAMVIANSFKGQPAKSPALDPAAVHQSLIERDPNIGLRSVLEYLWDSDIPVLPLQDAGAFHGACWRIAGRNVIVVKQRSHFTSRWEFDLLHELHHAGQDPEEASHSWIEEAELTSARRTSAEEQRANRFAADVLLNQRAEDLVSMCVKQAKGNLRNLKGAVVDVANAAGVRIDQLANYLAYRLSLQKENWWGAATNLQQEMGDPFLIARDVFLERFDFSRVDELSKKILLRSLMPEVGRQ